jgi:hypothetical protein
MAAHAANLIINKPKPNDITSFAVTSSQIDNNFSAPNLVGALVNVIIERAKQELTVAFFDRFKTDLQRMQALDTLFPKTTAFIVNIESYMYAGSLNTLRQAFSSDIANLPAQIPAAFNTDEVKQILIKHPQYSKALLMLPGVSLINSIMKGNSAGNDVKSLYPDTMVQKADTNIYAILQTIATLSESVRDSTGKTNWITPDSFNAQIATVKVNSDLFFGLLFEECKNIYYQPKPHAAPVSLSAFVGANSNAAAIQAAITAIINGFSGLTADIETLKNLKVADRFDQIITTINDLPPSCQTAFNSAATLFSISSAAQNAANQVFTFIPQLTAIVQNVHDTQYSAAVFNSIILFNTLLQNNQDTTVQNFLKYASFMAAIAESKTSADISNAIAAAILPAGSSSIKANTKFSISINSYIGAGMYWEVYNSNQIPGKNLTLPTFGVSLPIGVAVNWGTKGKAVGSLSVFASIIDLGAVASFKLSTPDSTTTQSLPNFTWQNLLAPGIYFVLGRIANSPLAFGIGVQKGPQLRSINYTQTSGAVIDLSQNEALRFGAFLTVDIPFFNLLSVPYKIPYTQ